jgi:hypothetical protein
MRHIPSKEKLHKVFGPYRDHIGDINMLRHLLVEWRDGHMPSRDMMREADGLLQGHGVEHLRSANGRAEAYYVNMGDTYNPTIVLDTMRDRVWATSWGDWLEAEERAGNRFD